MSYLYNSERYAMHMCQPKIESLFLNDIHQSTGTYVFPLHKHNDFLEISLILKGEEMVEFHEATYVAAAGDIIIKNATELHQETAVVESELVELSIGISGVKIDGLEENQLISAQLIPIIHTDGEMNVLKELCFSMYKMYHSGDAIYEATIDLTLKTFLSMLLLLIDTKSIRKLTPKKTKFSLKIVEILKYIDMNFCNQISLDDIAKEFYMSPYYLARQFKSEIGYSVNKYIQLRRLGMAEKRLAFEDTSIKEIALECGYPNLKYFYSIFKQKTGHTPREFRHLLQVGLSSETTSLFTPPDEI